MSTRMTIKLSDGDEAFYIYRHHDGYPENIIPDIEKVIEESKGRWSGSEVELLVTMFLGMFFTLKNRIQSYNITSAFHGDESYRYFIKWNKDKKIYEFGEME